jgi:ubiquitin carboxyl-terminal hydrolase 8
VKVAHEFNEDIRPGVQADGAEAIQILLDALHTQQAREVNMNIKGKAATADQAELIKSLESWVAFFRKEYSPIIDSFFGQTQKKVKCDTCHSCSTTYEPWGVFKVPIPGAEKAGAPAPTLQECIAAALAPEKMDDYFCETCAKKGPATIELSISKYPKQMILSLKRFINSGAKVRCRVPYDVDAISLNEWRAWPSIQGSLKYRVTSTIEHLGSSRGGHYIMRSRETEKPDEWYIYDDSRVAPCTAGGVATPDTYVLFLESCT